MTERSFSKGKEKYHHGNLRKILIDLALETLKEEGVHQLSLRGLARKAGVSQAAPYRHFKNKEDLIVALKTERLRSFEKDVRKLLEIKTDPLKRLKNLCMKYVRFAEKHPYFFKVIFEYEINDCKKYPELNDVSDKIVLYLIEIVDECMTLPNAKKKDSAMALVTIFSIVHGLSVLLTKQSSLEILKEHFFINIGDNNQIIEQVIELLGRLFICNGAMKEK